MTMKKILVSLAFVLLLVGGAAAQEKKPDSEGWQQVNGDMLQKGESIPASRLVAGAYGFIFASVVVFVASVVARTRKVEQELEDLKRALEAKGK